MESNYEIEYYKSLKGKAALEQRIMGGRLPIIDIHGHPFFVNIRIGTLRPMDNFHTMGIEVYKMRPDPETSMLSFYYHIPTNTEYKPPKDLMELPKDVVMVVTPNMLMLDPVGMAHWEGHDYKKYHIDRGIPLKMYRKARIIPVKKTALAQQVKENQQKAAKSVSQRQQQSRATRKRRNRL